MSGQATPRRGRPRLEAHVLLHEIRRIDRKYGPTLSVFRQFGAHDEKTLVRVFGSWNSARRAADLSVNRAGRRADATPEAS